MRCTQKACQTLCTCALHWFRATQPQLTRTSLFNPSIQRKHIRPAGTHETVLRRGFHDYFVTHLPSSSLHPDQRSSAGPRHQLPRDASRPHKASGSNSDPAPAPVIGLSRETTVVRIPLRSAKHHFGAAVSRGQRPYNEDTFQAGVIEIPAFAKRAPISLTGRRAAAARESPLAEYRRRQAAERKKEEKSKEDDKKKESTETEAGGAATSSLGDPQVFYFGVFDGHGGAECSEFLRDQLHSYAERSATDFGLKSSLKRSHPNPEVKVTGTVSGGLPTGTQTPGRPDPSDKPGDPKHPTTGSEDDSGPPKSSDAAEQGVDQDKAKGLEDDLLNTWKTRVGGYFRRFKPALFYDATDQSRSGADISTILTYAFLRADLDFISAQARKPSKAAENDPVKTDQAINATDTLEGESAIEIGGPTRFEGGSTCSVAMVSTPTPTPFWHPTTPATMIFAHVGDTRILLCRTSDGLAVPCTSNHHPSNPVEEKRLRRYSGQVVTDSFGEERIVGLANSRAFGDMRSKRVGVSAEPEVTRVEMAAAEYSFMVLMSDGISGPLSDQEVVDIVKEAKTPDSGANDVVKFATEVSMSGDNATCLVVRLGGWERRGEGGMGSMGTKEAREWRKEEASQPTARRT